MGGRFCDGGQNALLPGEGAGRPQGNPEQRRCIADAVRDRTPDWFRFELGLWTVRLIGSRTEQQFRRTLRLPTPLQGRSALGFTGQRLLYRA